MVLGNVEIVGADDLALSEQAAEHVIEPVSPAAAPHGRRLRDENRLVERDLRLHLADVLGECLGVVTPRVSSVDLGEPEDVNDVVPRVVVRV